MHVVAVLHNRVDAHSRVEPRLGPLPAHSLTGPSASQNRGNSVVAIHAVEPNDSHDGVSGEVLHLSETLLHVEHLVGGRVAAHDQSSQLGVEEVREYFPVSLESKIPRLKLKLQILK